MLQWKIFYEDRPPFSNLDGEAWDAPKRGVQAVVEHVPSVNFVVHSRGDFYVYNSKWDQPNWRMMDIAGFWDHMFEPGQKCVLFGRYASNKRWNEILVAATEFGQKETWLACEKK